MYKYMCVLVRVRVCVNLLALVGPSSLGPRRNNQEDEPPLTG